MIHTTNFKRLVCCLLAVLMLCTCVIRPLEAKATAVAVPLALASLGAFLVMYSVTAGVVIPYSDESHLELIGSDFLDFYGIKTEEDYDKQEWYLDLKLAIQESRAFGSNQLVPTPEGPYDRTPIGLTPGVLTALAVYIAKIATDGVRIKSELTAPDEYAYYNGILLKLPFTLSTQKLVLHSTDTGIWASFMNSSSKGWFYDDTTDHITPSHSGYEYFYNFADGTWSDRYSFNVLNGDFPAFDLLWSNTDIKYESDNSVIYFPAMEATDTAPDTIIEPIYITEGLPSDENGEPDPEEIEEKLPAVIYPQKLLYDTQKENLNEALQEVVSRLESGELTYEQYMETIQTEPQENPGGNPEDETQPGTSPDPTPDGSGDVDVKTGLGKLVDFFTGTTFVESPLQAMNFDKLFDLFPFNIPAGIYQTISFWNADATPPTLTLPSLAFDGNKVTGDEFSFNLADMPGMNEIAALIRAGVLILYAVGLLMITRKVTKW